MAGSPPDDALAAIGPELFVSAPRRSKSLWRSLTRNRTGMVAAMVLSAIVLFVIIVPFFPSSAIAMDLGNTLQAPSLRHLMGTDQFGRDIFVRVATGGRVTLSMGIVAVMIATAVGIPLGLMAGFYERLPDSITMRVMDMMLAFPGLLLALTVVAVLGPGIVKVMAAVGISLIPGYVRMMRGAVLSTKHNLYIEASRACGASDVRLLIRHIIPNSIAPMIVLITVSMGWAIVIGASLNFLGMGVQYPSPEWGSDLNSGHQYLAEAWWISTFPGVAIMVSILCFNLIGDALREVLDPRLQVMR